MTDTPKRATPSWQMPFRKLKDALRVGYRDAHLTVHHAIVLSATRKLPELQAAIDWLEPCIEGGKQIHSIIVESDGITHAHLFFGKTRTGMEFLSEKLHGLDGWLKRLPKGLLPKIEIPKLDSQADINLARWASLVYFLAWECDAVYLDAELEFRENAKSGTFLPWKECPQPPLCDPRDLLIRRTDSNEAIKTWTKKFEAEEKKLPEVIDTWLPKDLFFSSICAIDVLLFNLVDQREQASLTRQASKDRKSKRSGNKFETDKFYLTSLLQGHHRPENENADKPLKQPEIAELLGWDLNRVQRRMKLLFKRGLTGYKNAFAGGLPRGWKGTDKDMNQLFDAVSADDEFEMDSETE